MEKSRFFQVVVILSTYATQTLSQWHPPNQGSRPIVKISDGELQGVTIHPDPNSVVDVFRGIPYAQPPVGALRLKKPESPLPWSGVKDVGNDHTACLQNGHAQGQSEDCLKLDVYRSQNAAKQPVMVWIHGGGYTGGSKNTHGEHLVAKGVVFVSINYRLGPMGFSSTDESSMPGNYGMLDQIAALQWIQKNIAAFGGDPNSVTIFGGSAGSASCSLLILSPLAKGLFHRAIMESGVSSTSRDVPPPSLPVTLRQVTVNAGAAIGCNQSPGPDFLACIQNADAHAFFTAATNAARADHSSGPYRPVVENVFGFLPDNPLKLIERGEFTHVDTIRGFNSQEMGGIAANADKENDGMTMAEFDNLARGQLNDYPYLDANKYIKLLEEIYLKNVTDPIVIREKAVQMRSDLTFIGPIVRETIESRKHNNESKYYLYDFNYRATDSRLPDYAGVTHGSEGKFVFGIPSFAHVNQTDRDMSEMVMTMWTNFAKYSDPTPQGHTPQTLIHWDQFLAVKPNFLLIDSPMQLKTFDEPEQVAMLSLYESAVNEYLRALDGLGSPVVG